MSNEAQPVPSLARRFFGAGGAHRRLGGPGWHTVDRGGTLLEIEAIGQSRKLPKTTPTSLSPDMHY